MKCAATGATYDTIAAIRGAIGATCDRTCASAGRM